MIAGISLLLFVPTLLFPAILGKVIVFRLLIEAAFVLYAYLLWKDYDRYKPVWGIGAMALCIFIIVLFVAAINGVSLYTSFWGTLDRMDGLFTYMHFPIMFMVLSGLYKDRSAWIVPLRVFVVIAVALGLAGVYGLIVLDDVQYISGNQAFLAQALLFGAGMSIMLSMWEAQRAWLWRITAGFLVLVLFATAIRGAMLGVLVGGTVFALWYAWRSQAVRVRVAVGGVIVIGAVLLGSIVVFKDSGIVTRIEPLDRLAHLSLEDSSVATRLNAWTTAFDAFKERPVLGWGPEHYATAFNTHFNPEFISFAAASIWFDRAHNIIFGLAVEAGILGVLSYLFLFGVALWYGFQLYKQEAFAGMTIVALLSAYFVFNLTLFDTMYSLIPFYLLFAFLAVSNSSTQTDRIKRTGRSQLLRAGVSVASIALLGTGLYANISLLSPAQSAREAQVAAQSNASLGIVAPLLSDSLVHPGYGVRDFSLAATQALDAYVNDEIRADETFNDLATLIAEALERARANDKQDIKTHIALMNVYGMLNDFDSAEAAYNEAVDLFGTVPNVHFNGATVALASGDPKTALERAAAGLALNNKAPSLLWQHGVVLALADDTQAALDAFDASVSQGFIPRPHEALRVALTYGSFGDTKKERSWYERVVKTAESAFGTDEDSFTNNTAYITALIGLGRTIQAQEHLEMLLVRRPDWEQQLATFVASLRAQSE